MSSAADLAFADARPRETHMQFKIETRQADVMTALRTAAEWRFDRSTAAPEQGEHGASPEPRIDGA